VSGLTIETISDRDWRKPGEKIILAFINAKSGFYGKLLLRLNYPLPGPFESPSFAPLIPL
jgi:hypothetical protein